MRTTRAISYRSGDGFTSWTVVDATGVPVDEVDRYLHALRARSSSVNTIKTYARHLAAYYSWLDSAQLEWKEVDFDNLADFMFVFSNGIPPLEKRGGGERRDATQRSMAAVLREFYEHHRTNGQTLQHLHLTRSRSFSNRTASHFLAHIEARDRVSSNRLAQGRSISPSDTVQTIGGETDFQAMLRAANLVRDRLALSAFYDLGLRIGGAMGLRHSDLDNREKTVTIRRRDDNVNGALSKRRGEYKVDAPVRFFDLYMEYLLTESDRTDREADFLFINVRRAPLGTPCSSSNISQQCNAIGIRAGLGHVYPHMLRHTHATNLARAGWTGAMIAARLGHTQASSADVYIHLVNTDLKKRLNETESLIWPSLPDP